MASMGRSSSCAKTVRSRPAGKSTWTQRNTRSGPGTSTGPTACSSLIGQVNQIRRDNPAFRANHNLRFHEVDNEQIIAYSKSSEDGSNEVLVVVNLDPHYKQSGFITLPLEELGLDPRQPYQAHDLLTDARYLWHGARNYVELNPQTVPAHIFVIRRKVRTEHDFDYYL